MQREQKSFYREHDGPKTQLWRSARIKGALIALLIFAMGVCPAMAQNTEELAPLRFTLKQAVATSLQQSREISLARLQYETSRQEAGLTRSQFLPNLYTGSGVAYTSGFRLSGTGEGSAPARTFAQRARERAKDPGLHPPADAGRL